MKKERGHLHSNSTMVYCDAKIVDGRVVCPCGETPLECHLAVGYDVLLSAIVDRKIDGVLAARENNNG